jgi:hypothetical protein
MPGELTGLSLSSSLVMASAPEALEPVRLKTYIWAWSMAIPQSHHFLFCKIRTSDVGSYAVFFAF